MKQRMVTGIIAGAFFITFLIIGGPLYAFLVLLMAIVGLFEFSRMNKLAWSNPLHIISLIALIALVCPFELLGGSWISNQVVTWLLLFVLLAYTVLSKNKYTIDEVALSFLGTIYLGFGFSSMIDVRFIETNGFLWSIFAFFTIWASDTGAYFFGRAFGKHKLWPQISPNKTVEGAIGGVFSSIIIAIIFAIVAPELVEIWRAVLIGFVAAVAGQFGDLIQSAYKRVRNIKDMGNLLPGHGGVIDRTDSWIIVFPILVLTQLIPV